MDHKAMDKLLSKRGGLKEKPDGRTTSSLIAGTIEPSEIPNDLFLVFEFKNVGPQTRSQRVLVRKDFDQRLIPMFSYYGRQFVGFNEEDTRKFSDEFADELGQKESIHSRDQRIAEAILSLLGTKRMIPEFVRINSLGVPSTSMLVTNFMNQTFPAFEKFIRKTFILRGRAAGILGATFSIEFPLTSFHSTIRQISDIQRLDHIQVLDTLIHTLFTAILPLFSNDPTVFTVIPVLNVQTEDGLNYYRIPVSNLIGFIPTFNTGNPLRTEIVSIVLQEFFNRFFREYSKEIVSFDIEYIIFQTAFEKAREHPAYIIFNKIQEKFNEIQARQKRGFTVPEVIEKYILSEKRKLSRVGTDVAYDCMEIFLFATVYMIYNHVRDISAFHNVKLVSSTQFFRKDDPFWITFRRIKDQGFSIVLEAIENHYKISIPKMIFHYDEDGFIREIIFPSNIPKDISPLAIVFIYSMNNENKAHIEFSLSCHIKDILGNIQRVRNIKPLSLVNHEAIQDQPFSSNQSFNVFWKMLRQNVKKKASMAFFRREEEKKVEEEEKIFLYWDIETYSHDRRQPFLSVLSMGKKEQPNVFWGDNCIENTLSFLQGLLQGQIQNQKEKQIIIWTYNGSRFDNMYLLPFIQSGEIFGTKTFAKGLSIDFNIFNKDKKFEQRRIFFYDFCLTLGGGLERVYKEIHPDGELSKKKYHIDASQFTNDYIITHREEIISYCINDVHMLEDSIQKFFIDLKTRLPKLSIPTAIMSASSLAWKVFSNNFLPICKKGKDFQKAPHGLLRFIYNNVKKSYYGGYTQCFEKEMGKGYYYDINSSYPNVMKNKIPLKFIEGYDLENYPKKEELITLHFLKSWSFPKGFPYPTIPVKTKNGNYYPRTGKDTYIWDHAYLFAKNYLGLQAEEDQEKAIHFISGDIFSEYIDTFYQIKSKESGALKLFSKLMLNSLYGKCGEEEHDKLFLSNGIEISSKVDKLLKTGRWFMKDVQIKTEDEQVITTLTPNLDIDPSHIGSLIHIASWITSMARLEIQKVIFWIHNNGGKVYYCDTDSIFSNIPLPETLISSSELGKWKLEYEVERGRFWGSKFYSVEEKGNKKVHVHVKGLQGKLITEEIKEKLWQLPLNVEEWNEEEMTKVWISPTFNRQWGCVIDKPFFKAIQQTTGIRRNFQGIKSKPWDYVNFEKGLGYADLEMISY